MCDYFKLAHLASHSYQLYTTRMLHGVPNADQLQIILHFVDIQLGVTVEQVHTKLTSRDRKGSISFACLEGNACGEAVRGEHRGDDVPLLRGILSGNVLSSTLVSVFKVYVSGFNVRELESLGCVRPQCG